MMALCSPCRADKSGQTAMHWAAVRGSLLAGEALLSHGADLRIQDGRGYTTCHVAAQYGQTAFIYMCALRWRADIDRCDGIAVHLPQRVYMSGWT